MLGDGSGPANPASRPSQRPVVISTWFGPAVDAAWDYANHSFGALDIVEAGCAFCEAAECDHTVGWGGSSDTFGETTLDALIMDGGSHDVGAVADLRRVKGAISAARKVMHYTTHSILAGEGATNFSLAMGMPEEDLHSNFSVGDYNAWRGRNCQPNFWANVVDGNTTCGPYTPIPTPAPTPIPLRAAPPGRAGQWLVAGAGGAGDGRRAWPTPSPAGPPRQRPTRATRQDHDTIGMCALDVSGSIAVGVSSNGADHKVMGRVGDAPIVGAGGYASNEAGCAAATGDGDITMRFLPAYQAVENMRRGMSPTDACIDAVRRIAKYYPVFELGLLCMDAQGQYGAASHGWDFVYCVAAPDTEGKVVCNTVQPNT